MLTGLKSRQGKYPVILRVFLFIIMFGLLTISGSCIHRQSRRFFETPLQDMVDHDILRSAGVDVEKLPSRFHDEKLGVFVSQFVKDAKKRGVYITAETLGMLREIKYVKELSMGNVPGVMAACNRYFVYQATLGGRKKVKWLSIEVLERQSKEYTGTDPAKELILLRELMYHELFHCLLNKGHLPEGVEGIMSPSFTKGSRRAFEDWEGLLNDMFSPKFLRLIPDAPFS